MITPGNEIPLDDSQENDMDDQQSQQDIHSNGFDEEDEAPENELDHEADVDKLQQASDASEPSFTLDLDRDALHKPEKKD